MKQVLVLLLAAALVPHALRAQSAASARIEGVVTDSVYGKPAVGATVLLTRIAPEPSELRTLDAELPPHRKGFAHRDQLGLAAEIFDTPPSISTRSTSRCRRARLRSRPDRRRV